MNAEDRERQVEQWLDQALARYSDVEPRTGLEQRILANLHSQPQRRLWWQWMWVPVAALVLIVVGMVWTSRQRAQPTPAVRVKSEIPAPVQPAPEPAPQIARSVRPVTPPRRAPATVQAAKAEERATRREVFPSRDSVGAMFPSPAPLNGQEIALMHLARRDPEEVRTIAQEQEADRQRLAKMFEETAVPRK